jgi:hypothetical protein
MNPEGSSTVDPRPRARSVSRSIRKAGALVLVACAALVLWTSAWGHRRPPTPDGMLFRRVVSEVRTPFDKFGVFAVDRGGPAVAIFDADARRGSGMLSTYCYPAGKLVEQETGARAQQMARDLSTSAEEAETRPFDFDGDGIADTLEIGGVPETGRVRVLSGRDRHVLFEDDDPLEYEGEDRAIPLGDLDGDGYAELALVHPRMDRSRYDFELWDLLLGARSWITIVSGSRIAR